MARLFTGIKIPQITQQKLALSRGKLKNARWMEPDDYHVTLRFIGDVSAEMAWEIEQKLAGIGGKPFSLVMDQLGIYGSKKPRTLYAAVQSHPALTKLHIEHENAMRQLRLEPESRNYSPHVTLARLSAVRGEDVAYYMSQHGAGMRYEFEVTQFALFSARESIGGGPYNVERVYDFG